ncbi:MAG: sel1 repeat family protein, partial [Magnetococcales bacterium]|nr:sel1 repeat family protein [Magnetococcales bacterium]
EDITDAELARGLYKKYFSHLDRATVYQRLGVDPQGAPRTFVSLRDYRASHRGQYDTLTDAELADAIHGKYYPDLDRALFDRSIGLEHPADPQTARDLDAGLMAARSAYRQAEDGRALRLFLRLAQRGSPVAQFNTGYMYMNGIGVTADPRLGELWYRKAARAGHLPAQFNLGLLLLGRGPERSAAATEGILWLQRAAEAGDRDAQFNLGHCHQIGRGVARDPARAYLWFHRAARAGDAEAARRRDWLEQELDPAQVDRLRREAEFPPSAETG